MKLKTKLQTHLLKLILLLPLIFETGYVIQAQNVSPKRGIAYGNNTTSDLSLLSPGVSWWYNWSEIPESSVLDSYSGLGMDFVPMAWNGNFNVQRLRNYLLTHPDVKYILGFNEPNFISQANMTPDPGCGQMAGD